MATMDAAARLEDRLSSLQKQWQWDFDVLVVAIGEDPDADVQGKSIAFFKWLLGTEEEPDTAFVQSSSSTAPGSGGNSRYTNVAVGVSKGGAVAAFSSRSNVLELLPKAPESTLKLLPTSSEPGDFAQYLTSLFPEKKAKIATPTSERHSGAFASELREALESKFVLTDAAEAISKLLTVRTRDDIENSRTSGVIAQYMMKRAVMTKLVDMVDYDVAKTGKELEQEASKALKDKATWGSLIAKSPGCEFNLLSIQTDKCHNIDELRTPSVESKLPMQGCYTLTLGCTYRGYNAVISRTIVIDPRDSIKKTYLAAYKVHSYIMNNVKAGVTFKDLHAQALQQWNSVDIGIPVSICKSFGFVMGLERHDKLLEITSENSRTIEHGMTLCITLAVSGNDPTSGSFSARISDTLLVPFDKEMDAKNEVPTNNCSSRAKDIMYEIGEEGEGDTAMDEPAPSAAPPPAAPAQAKAPEAPKPAVSAAPPAADGNAKAKAKSEAKAKAKGRPKAKAKEEAPSEVGLPLKGEADIEAKSEVSTAVSASPKANAKAKGKSKAKPKPAAPPPKKAKKEMPPPPPPKKRPRHEREAPQPRERATRQRSIAAKEEMSEMTALEAKNRERQKKKVEELQARFSEQEAAEAVEEHEQFSKYQSYSAPNKVPAAGVTRVTLDKKAEALLLPIGGFLWPLHVRLIRNMSRQKDGAVQKLRINLFTPGGGKPAESFPIPVINSAYVKELSFQSDSGEHLDTICEGFKELRKNQRTGDARKGQKAAVANDESLKLLPKFPCIRDVFMRPTLGSGRRTQGSLQAHANGFRFSYGRGVENVDILYSRVGHAVFHPCEGALIVLFHLHLKEPMQVGSKTTTDIQFFTETGSLTEDLSQRRGGDAHDPDEMFEEQREREMIEKLNKLFQDFSRQVEALPGCPFQVDIPFSKLMFQGVPAKQAVDLFPTKHALVSLREWPPFVMDMRKVDIVCIERAIATLREFDIVFVMKDYNVNPVRITTVPQAKMSQIKRWLSELGITWYTSAFNLQWQKVMKEINQNLAHFASDGGWDRWLGEEREAAGSDSESQEQSGGSDYKDEDDDDDTEESLEDDGDDVDEDEAEDSSETEDDESEDEGLTWDELERKAELADKKSAARDAQNAKAAPAPAAKKRRR
mmetsp:Transcript_66673/g.159385  ORF Transcript_66673/g.159385 Transcript_66673/m.159385 type:complete len:1151 (-) Transcript_66673:70-3522(-)